MELTKKQLEGLKIANERFKNREKFTVIAGYAGTGKSTLVKFIVQNLPGVDPDEDVCYATFTGKAAQVLLKKGNKNVSTLHKLLYQSIPRPDGTFFRRPVESIDYTIVIVDEVSMAPKSLMQQLMKYNVHVICLGDPFQLPTIEKDEDNHLLDNPHIFLDEIMRQEAESEIIRLTMDIRNYKPIDLLNGNEVKVFDKSDLNTGMMTWADQILVGTNATRTSMNAQMRDLMGRQGGPQTGDKVICLRNYWDIMADNEDPLVNGTIGHIEDCYSNYFYLPFYMGGDKIDTLGCNFISDSGARFGSMQLDTKMILTGEKCVDWKTAYRMEKNPKTKGLLPFEFTYGYAITTHKAQGSEWDKVLVIEERFPFDKEEHARWLYTACTRAAEKLILIRK